MKKFELINTVIFAKTLDYSIKTNDSVDKMIDDLSNAIAKDGYVSSNLFDSVNILVRRCEKFEPLNNNDLSIMDIIREYNTHKTFYVTENINLTTYLVYFWLKKIAHTSINDLGYTDTEYNNKLNA